MKRTHRSLLRWGKSALCVLLAAAVVTGAAGLSGLGTAARGAERTYDIGVNAESVLATLDQEGLLTVSGSGAIRDYTPETAPFAGADVKDLKIGADITAIGDYAFYGCPGLTGGMELPAGLLRIGDGAFSGESAELAAAPAFVHNSFTDALVTKKREAEPDPVSEPEAETSPAPPEAEEAPEVSEETAAAEEETKEPGSVSLPETSPSPDGEDGEAPQEPAVPADPEGPVTEETADAEEAGGSEAAAQAAEEPEDGSSRFTIEKITQQEVGKEIFFPREDSPSFTCSAGNEGFRAAMTAAGFVEAGGLIGVVLDPGEGSSEEDGVLSLELPVVAGRLELPGEPEGFLPPAADGLYSYSFGGWTESEDGANVVRQAGSAYETGARETLYFIANWTRTVQVRLQAAWEDSDVILSVPEIDGYDVVSCQWQTCLPSREELEQGVDLLPWKDMEDAQESLRWTVTQEDKGRQFRCLISVRKQQNFFQWLFSAPAQEQTVALAAVRINGPRRAAAAGMEGWVVLDPGEGSGTMAAVPVQGDGKAVAPECAFTAPDDDMVFCGWQDDGGSHVDPGDVIDGGGAPVLTAKWDTPTVKTAASADDLYTALASFTDSSEEGIYLNVIRLASDVVLEGDPGTGARLSAEGEDTAEVRPCTITSQDPAAPCRLVCGDAAGIVQCGDVRYADVVLAVKYIGANAHRLVLASGARPVGMTGVCGSTALTEGEGAKALTGSADIRVFSGNFEAVYGSGLRSGLVGPGKGRVRIFIGGTGENHAVVTRVFGAGQGSESSVANRADVIVAQDAEVTAVYGSGDEGKAAYSSGTGNGAYVEIRGGSVGTVFGGGKGPGSQVGAADLAKGGCTQVTITDGEISGDVYTGGDNGGVAGCDANSLEIYGGLIGGSVYGGGNADMQRDTAVTIYGGTIEGSVYGGGRLGKIGGRFGGRDAVASASVTMLGGTVGGDVFAGGCQGAVTGSGAVIISGGTVGGSVYGGGEAAPVGGSPAVNVSLEDAVVLGSVYGGGKGGTASLAGNAFVQAVRSNIGGDVYGGGDQGVVSGGAKVALSDTTVGSGAVGGSVYGGGNAGNIGGGTTVEIAGGAVRRNVYGGGKNGSLSAEGAAAQVTLKDGVTVRGNVYGAGQGRDSAVPETAVTVESGVVEGSLYGGGALGRVTGTTLVALTDGEIHGSLFGGGEGDKENTGTLSDGLVGTSTRVVVAGGSVDGSVYGGGDLGPVGEGIDATIQITGTQRTAVEIIGGTVGRNVFGGGAGDGGSSFGGVFGDTLVTMTGGTAGNVFGGGSRAHVAGHTQVLVSGAAKVDDSVYGGGNLGDSSDSSFTGTVLVHGGSEVLVDGAQGADIGGNILGSGNLTEVEPQEDCQLTIRNFSRGLTLGSIQRTASAKIIDSALVLTGGSDVSHGSGAGNYALTRIGELELTCSDLTLLAAARDLRGLANGDDARPSVLRLLSGLSLRVAETAGGGNAYGTVKGSLLLDMVLRDDEGDRVGVRVQADTASSGGFEKNSAAGSVAAPYPWTTGEVPGAYRYWQLGDPVERVETTLTASYDKEGGLRADTPDPVTINIHAGGSILRVVKVEKVSGNFHLVRPGEDARGEMLTGTSVSLTLPAGGTAGNTFALRARPVGTGWANLDRSGRGGAYLLTDVDRGEGLIRTAPEAPRSSAGGDAALELSLLYDSSQKIFEEGEVRVYIEEITETDTGEVLEGTTVLSVTITGNQDITSQNSVITAGRKITSALTGDSAEIAPQGAVTALFTSRFAAQGLGTLQLYREDAGGPAAVDFPAGTKVIMGDFTNEETTGAVYYYYQCGAAVSGIGLGLLDNMNLNGAEKYRGFADGETASEKMLFAVDFSGVSTPLAEDQDYCLLLRHRGEEDWEDLAPARFRVSGAGSASLEITDSISSGLTWQVTLKPQVSAMDTRYADGASVQFSLALREGGGTVAARFPQGMEVESGGVKQAVLWDRSGTINCPLPLDSGTTTLTFRFDKVPESMIAGGDYELTAVMIPRVGLQISSDGADSGVTGVRAAPVGLTLDRGGSPLQRSLSVSIADSSQRLLDVSESSRELELSVQYNAQPGDTIVTRALVKTRKGAPSDDSYSAVTNGDQWTFGSVNVSGAGAAGTTLSVTVPKGTPSGTYRIQVLILDGSGNRMAEEPFNIIVK